MQTCFMQLVFAGIMTQPSATTEVRYLDGTTVRVQLNETALDVQTKYGKLTIPLAEIRRIEPGVPTTQRKAIEELIRQLGAGAFKERDTAAKSIIEHGLAAVAVLRANPSPDLEVRKRTDELIRRLEEAAPLGSKPRALHDTVQAAEFTFTGNLLHENLKARSRHFGDCEVKLADVETISFRSESDGKVQVKADGKWLDTGVTIDAGSQLHVVAEGAVDLWPQQAGQYVVTPKGYVVNGNTVIGKDSSLPAGALAYRIGETGVPMMLGERFDGFVMPGRLYLSVVSSPWNNESTGAYSVRIRVVSK